MTWDVALILAAGFALGCYFLACGLEELGDGIARGLDDLGRWLEPHLPGDDS